MIPTAIQESAYGTAWAARMRSSANPATDFERGGVGVGDTSQGLFGYDWTAYYDSSLDQVFLYREDLGNATRVALVSNSSISRVALAFDQNMRPVLAWLDDDGCSLWYYRAGSSSFEATMIPDAQFPCLTLDERRPAAVENSDVLLTYTKGNDLFCRVQREGYAIEHNLYTAVPNPEVLAFGMTKEMRLQWRLRP